MQAVLSWLFSPQDYMPHGMCLLWQPWLMMLHIASDSAIAVAYYSIPIAVLYFLSRRRDLVFRKLFLLTSLFILACGTTHLMNVWTLWHPDYRADGLIKAFTAIVSVATAILLWRIMPAALRLASPTQFAEINGALAAEIAQRKQAEAVLRDAKLLLEDRVHARTAELEQANARLQQEIADRERAERAKAEGDAMFRAVFETSTDALLVIDADTIVYYANPAVEVIFGYPVEEVIGADLSKLQPPHLRAPHRAALQRYIETGERHLNWRATEIAGLHRDGHEIQIEISFNHLKLAGRDLFVGFVRDITERKQREAERVAHMQENMRLSAAVAATKSGVVITDETQPGRPIVYVNPAFSAITGYSLEEALGTSRFLRGPDTDPAALKAIEEAIAEGRDLSIDILYYRKNGEPFWSQLSLSPIFDADHRVTHYVWVQNDVTESRLLEDKLRQSQKMDTIGQLTGGVAHDFNNLLAVIIGNLELLAEKDIDANDERNLLQPALRAALSGAELTGRLLAFSRRQPLKPVTLDLNETVTQLKPLLRRTLGETIDLQILPHPDIAHCYADASQLENALLNLVINARDAMPKGGRIVVEMENASLDERYAAANVDVTAGDYVLISVSDDGIGMDADTCKRAFEPFFTTKDVGKSTGLGLSMVYGFVKQSGGHVAIYSEPGHGTTVKLFLPRASAGGAPSSSEETAGGAPLVPLGGIVVIVEDQPDVRQIARRQFEDIGFMVLEAGTAKEAMEVFARHAKVDLLFTDIMLPGGMLGPELAAELRRQRPDLKILFASGYSEKLAMRPGGIAPDEHLLSKPYRKKELEQMVRRIMAGG